MNSRLISVGGITSIVLGAIAFLTNPQQHDYREYAVQTLNIHLKEFCRQSDNLPGEWLQNHCYVLVDTARPYLGATIDTHTLRHDFLVFSFYRTNLPVPTSLADYQIETIGIFNNFYTYKIEEL